MAENRQSINLDINGNDNSAAALRNAANNLQGVETSARQASTALGAMDANATEANAELQRMASSTGAVSTGFTGVSGAVGSAWNQIKGFIGAYVGIQTATEVIKMSDDFKDLESKIQLATDSSSEFNQVMDGLNKISSATGSAIDDNATLYARMAGTLKDAGKSTEDLLTLTDIVAKSLKVSGASTAEASSFTTQFAQAMGSGVLRGEEFNAMMESNVRFARALATGLNVPIGALRAMAEEGELTADVIFNAVSPSLASLTAESESMGVKVSSSWVKVKNAMEQWVGQADKNSGATDKLIDLLDDLAGSFQDSESAINVVSTAIGNFTSQLGTAYDKLFAVNGVFGDFFGNLKSATIGLLDLTNQYENQIEASDNLYGNTLKLDEKLQQISRTTGINITSQQGFNVAVDAGLVIFDQITQTWQNGAGLLERVSEQTGRAFSTQQQFNDAVANGTLVVDSANGVYKTAAVSLKEVASSNKDVSSTQSGISATTQTVASNIKSMGDTSKSVSSSMGQDAANISSSYKSIIPSILQVVNAMQQQQVAAQNAHEAANQANAAWENATDAAAQAQRDKERQDHRDNLNQPVSFKLNSVDPITAQLSQEGQAEYIRRVNTFKQDESLAYIQAIKNGKWGAYYENRAKSIAEEILALETATKADRANAEKRKQIIADRDAAQQKLDEQYRSGTNTTTPNNAQRGASTGGGAIGFGSTSGGASGGFSGSGNTAGFLQPINYGANFSSGGGFVGQSGGEVAGLSAPRSLMDMIENTPGNQRPMISSSSTGTTTVTFAGTNGRPVIARFENQIEVEQFLNQLENAQSMSIRR